MSSGNSCSVSTPRAWRGALRRGAGGQRGGARIGPRGRRLTCRCSSARSGSCSPDAARNRASARASGPEPGRSARRNSAWAAARNAGLGPTRRGASSHTVAARSGRSVARLGSCTRGKRTRSAPVGQRASSHARRGARCRGSCHAAAIRRLCYRHLISRASSPTRRVRKHDAVRTGGAGWAAPPIGSGAIGGTTMPR